jgi:hypothetical protein
MCEREEYVRILLLNPLAPTLGGRKRGVGGRPQTLGREESLHLLGISTTGGTGEAKLARDAHM